MDRSHPSPRAPEMPMRLQARERERERERQLARLRVNSVTKSCHALVKCGFGPPRSSTTTTLGAATSASNHSNLQGLDSLKASITGDHDGMRPHLQAA